VNNLAQTAGARYPQGMTWPRTSSLPRAFGAWSRPAARSTREREGSAVRWCAVPTDILAWTGCIGPCHCRSVTHAPLAHRSPHRGQTRGHWSSSMCRTRKSDWVALLWPVPCLVGLLRGPDRNGPLRCRLTPPRLPVRCFRRFSVLKRGPLGSAASQPSERRRVWVRWQLHRPMTSLRRCFLTASRL
jgi:hypothetical protein